MRVERDEQIEGDQEEMEEKEEHGGGEGEFASATHFNTLQLTATQCSHGKNGGGGGGDDAIPVGVPLFLRVTLTNEWGEVIEGVERKRAGTSVLQCVAVCCGVLRCVAVCCRVL